MLLRCENFNRQNTLSSIDITNLDVQQLVPTHKFRLSQSENRLVESIEIEDTRRPSVVTAEIDAQPNFEDCNCRSFDFSLVTLGSPVENIERANNRSSCSCLC